MQEFDEERHGNKNQQDLLKIYFKFDNAATDLVADIYKLSDESRGVFVLLEDLKDFHEELINLALKLSQYGYRDVYEIYAEFDGDFSERKTLTDEGIEN